MRMAWRESLDSGLTVAFLGFSVQRGHARSLGRERGGISRSRLLIEQIAPFATEDARNLIDGLQSDILHAPLGAAEMRPLQLHQIACGLLGQPLGHPEAAQVQAEYHEDIHARMGTQFVF